MTISEHLNAVLQDWRESHNEFPNNAIQGPVWPVPFFGNPATAIVATVGVNPSSGEFAPARRWGEVSTSRDWKLRLKNYFNHEVPPHEWFDPWRIGLALLDCSYEAGTAAHIDVSYRPTTGMVTNQRTDPKEFRAMAERDVQWLFRLLPLCPKLRLLLTMGPIIGDKSGRPVLLHGFLHEFAPRHGFKVVKHETFWEFWHEESRKVLVVHDADTPDEKCIACRVVKNIHANRDELMKCLGNGAGGQCK